MTPFRRFAWAAMAVFATGSGSASAAWNNVFQVCCDSCRSSVSAASPIVAVPAAPACGDPAPQQQCTTRYVQRSYYQPVTTYQQRTFYEPVTTFRTSYYYEPVTSYRFSSYFDPCTGSCQQVATPVTSFRLRSQCNPVTSYLQRCQMQPVTSYQIAYYFEPQTTCCQTTIGAPVLAVPTPAPAPAGVAVPAMPSAPAGQPAVPPSVGEQRQLAVPPGVSDSPGAAPSSSDSQKLPSAPVPATPGTAGGATFRPNPSYAPATPSYATPPSVRLDRIVALPGSKLEGEVIGADGRPGARVQLLFAHADKQNTQQSVTADDAGKFHVTLVAGTWLVYTRHANGQTEFRRKIEIRDGESTLLQLVSR